MRSGSLARQTQSVPGKPIGQEWDARTYTGVGPHPADPRAAQVAAQVMALINQIRPGTSADHVGSTAVPGLIGKNVVDLQITASPAEVPAITGARRDPWPPERPMLEGTFRSRDRVFAITAMSCPPPTPTCAR